jgi:hypothetical protein
LKDVWVLRSDPEETKDHEALEVDIVEAVTSGHERIVVEVIWSWDVS